jgi:nucleoside-diphosphate-sugar epimerase
VIALVTGAAGFVGRHMTAELNRRGWTVVRADPEDGLDALNIFRSATSTRYDLIVHAAASAPHRAAIDGEAEHFARNVHLDAAMFDWAVRTGQGRVLYLSSSAAYPIELQDSPIWGPPDSPVWHVLAEDDIQLDDASEPDAAYGWTKLTGERMAEAARRKGLPVTVVRPFSGYGEDQSENFPFRAILERVKRREDPLTIWGDGEQVRDWIHIDDVVAGALAVAESGTDEPVNLCTGIGTSMLGLAKLACHLARHVPRVELLTGKPAGVAYRVGDPTRFHQFYKPTVTLAEGVARAL